MNQWRRFQFFDTSEVTEEGTTTPIQVSPKYDLSCSTSGHGTLVFGDNEGNIHLLDREFRAVTFNAFDSKVIKVQQRSTQNVLVAVGEDFVNEDVTLTQIKVWSLDKEGKGGGPLLVRMQRIFPSKTIPEAAITCFCATDDMTQIVVGFANGVVLLFRGDMMRDRLTNRSKMLCPPAQSPVTGLHFRGQGKGTTLFVVTSTSVHSYATGNKSDAQVVLSEETGAEINCSTLSHDQDLVVGRTEAVYFYVADDCGPCYGLDGYKHHLSWFRNYLVVVSSDPTSKTAANHLHVHDLRNKFIAFNGTFSDIKCVLCEFGSIFVVTADCKVYQLTERDTSSKLETLFRKNLYGIAVSLASGQHYDTTLVTDIYRKYGDHLYAKADYDAAVDQYVKTIGRLEPSYVIRKFLDAQRTHNLTQYLQALHEKSLATSDHTTLLLNCYTKLKDTQRLESFLENTSLHFDPDVAIAVLRQAGYVKHALELAERGGQHDSVVEVLLEDMFDFNKALRYIWSLPFDHAKRAMSKQGKTLVSHTPDQTTALLMQLCTKYTPQQQLEQAGLPDDDAPVLAADPEEFVHIFAAQPAWLMVFLEFVVAQKPEAATELINNTLLELYLRDESTSPTTVPESKTETAAEAATTTTTTETEEQQQQATTTGAGSRLSLSTEDRRQKALVLLAGSKYTPDHAMFLCQMCGFHDGTLLLLKRQGLGQEVLNVHMRAGNHQAVIDACISQSDPNLWAQVLQYFATEVEGDTTTLLSQVLSHIDRENILPPLRVVEILSKNPHVTLDMVKDYLLKRLEMEHTEIAQDEEQVRGYEEETKRMREEIKELRTSAKIFQSQKCADCTNPLKLPSCHFFCGHSFHQRCLADDRECLICAPHNTKILQARDETIRAATDHQQFLNKLEVSGDGFSAIAEYFGHGIFVDEP